MRATYVCNQMRGFRLNFDRPSKNRNNPNATRMAKKRMFVPRRAWDSLIAIPTSMNTKYKPARVTKNQKALFKSFFIPSSWHNTCGMLPVEATPAWRWSDEAASSGFSVYRPVPPLRARPNEGFTITGRTSRPMARKSPSRWAAEGWPRSLNRDPKHRRRARRLRRPSAP